MKTVLILGANFQNKGAQSMLFTTTAEIKKININCTVYFATTKRYKNEEDYFFESVWYSYPARKIALGEKRLYNILKETIKDFARLLFKREKVKFRTFMDLNNILPNVDLIIDISGFALGEKWPVAGQEKYLDGIRLARKYKIPIILMPQSFGPFNYTNESKFLLNEIAELLAYPDIIFTREKAGYDELKDKFQLTNIKISSDLVLQSKVVNPEMILKTECSDKNDRQLPDVIGNERVAIIPNMQCFRRGDEKKILNYYKMCIDLILDSNKEIYIFRHSEEDWKPCQLIYQIYEGNEHVHLLDNDFSCIEYDEFIKNFDFIICSRFHGIVHAYRNGVPAIILGWAIKYSELAELLSQSQYVFNIVEDQINSSKLEHVTSEMLKKWKIESSFIKGKIVEIQKDSCFRYLEDYLKE